MRVHWKVILAGTALALIGLALWARNPLKNPRVVQELGLTPEQVQRLDDLQYQHQRQMIDVRRDLALRRLDLRRELEKDNPDRAAVDRLTDETSALQGQMRKLKTGHMLDARKVLTPEQWEKAKQMLAERRQGMRERRVERRQDFRGGPGRGEARPGRGQGTAAPGPGASFDDAPGSDLPAPGDFAGMLGDEEEEP